METLKLVGIWAALILLYATALNWVIERLGINLDVALIGSLVFLGLLVTLVITIALEDRISKNLTKKEKR